MRLESDQALVKIVTMHKSKGLQYPIVFCPFLWHGPNIENKDVPLEYRDPDNPATAYLDLHGKKDPDRAQKRFFSEREELAESLRLTYVAMTRAECCLYLSWALATSTELSALGYLLQPADKALDLLKAKVKVIEEASWSGDQMHKKIGSLCENYPSLFTLGNLNDEADEKKSKNNGETDSPESLYVKSFDRSLPLLTSYSVSSFSSLSSLVEEDDPDVPDYDQFIDYAEINYSTEETPTERSIFTFPKGPQPGTCIHNVFENIDFTDPDPAVIAEQLQMQGIDTKWKTVVLNMLRCVLNKPLHPHENTLTMNAISGDRMIPEMEFYYQNEKIETPKLLSIIRPNSTEPKTGYREASAGFLKGFIDLTFEYNGKYYLLDYKTNHLGNTVADYAQEYLEEEMQEAFYDLQYHIYTVALHRFLNAKIPNYSYDTHFGGAFYLFLRGMNENGREGVFFDRPDLSTITTLNNYIKGDRNG